MGSDQHDALRLFHLDARVALVTGASSGLGAAVARSLAAAGARVAVAARREDRLAALAGEIGGVALGCDLLDAAQVDGLVERVADELGGPEILVNAAGALVTSAPAEDEPLDAIEQTLALNLVAPFRLSQAAFPHMNGGPSATSRRSAGASGSPASRRRRTPPPRRGCPA
jgi:NAD(P)-dependent dehydrogenase (short-subunit alcohol dehydrogenase family)